MMNYQTCQNNQISQKEVDQDDSQIQLKKILQQLETPDKEQLAASNQIDNLEKQLKQIMAKLQMRYEIPNYSDVNYWNSHYCTQNQKFYDWLQSYQAIKSYIQQILKYKSKNAQILYIGCGNSQLAEQLYYDGYKNITCIDFSSVVINNMQQYYKKICPEIKFQIMDATQLQFNDQQFDLIIDKGTFDVIVQGENCVDKINNMMKKIKTILKITGFYMCLSYGEPIIRMNYFQHQKLWDIQIFEIKKQNYNNSPIDQLKIPKSHYLYVCQNNIKKE